jgi:hypothetical protein
MSNPTPTTALRDVIEALDKAMEPGASPTYMERFDSIASNFMAEHATTIIRALAVMEAVEAAPVVKVRGKVGELATICVSHDFVGQRVALVRVGEV